MRLERALSSDTAQVEDRFEATTAVDLRENGRVLIPAGSRVRGVVTAVKNAGRVERKGELQLSFDQITINGRNYPMRATVTEALEAGGYRDDAGKIGAGAAVGGIIGGILGGVKGAVAGILIGGGGVVAATEGRGRRTAGRHRAAGAAGSDLTVERLTRQTRTRGPTSRMAYARARPPANRPVIALARGRDRLLDVARACALPEMNHASNCDGGR